MPDNHPSDETWESLATGELDPPGRAAVMTHVVGCARCARAWRAIRQIAQEAREFDPGVPIGAPRDGARAPSAGRILPFRRTRRALVGGGLVAIAAAAVLVLWLRTGRESSPDGTDVVRGDVVDRVELIVPTAGAGSRLAWRAFAGAEQYVVEVFTLDGRLHWRRDAITAVEVAVEPPLAAGEYRWQVVAWAHGSRLAVSRPGRFVVAR